jgi:hypothetical protein
MWMVLLSLLRQAAATAAARQLSLKEVRQQPAQVLLAVQQ